MNLYELSANSCEHATVECEAENIGVCEMSEQEGGRERLGLHAEVLSEFELHGASRDWVEAEEGYIGADNNVNEGRLGTLAKQFLHFI